MSAISRLVVRRRLLPAVPAVLLAVLAVLVAVPASPAKDEGALRRQIGSAKSRERTLSGAVARLAALERRTGREVAILERRLADAETELTAAQARLARSQGELRTARARVARLRARLADVQDRLSLLLRERYMTGRPDIVSVVLDAHGFADLLERFEFLHRVEDRDSALLGLVRAARVDAHREAAALTRLVRRRTAAEIAVHRRRDALASMHEALAARRAALAQARAARLAALHATRAGRARAERALDRLLAARARAQRAAGPGGPWAIPWPVVQCESGGQNLPPNEATASGYYQILDSTWAGLGGSTPHAYQAPKAEQDRLAARLWNGGRGASNWVCAFLVGIL